MVKTTYRRSLVYTVLGIVVFVGMIFLGAMGLLQENLILGCVMTPMGAIFLFIAIRYGLLDTNPRVVLDDQGISARDWGGARILWADINDVRIVSMPRAGSSITIILRDKEKYLQQLSQDEFFARKMSKWFTNAEFSFISNSLDASTNCIYEEIKKRIQDHSTSK